MAGGPGLPAPGLASPEAANTYNTNTHESPASKGIQTPGMLEGLVLPAPGGGPSASTGTSRGTIQDPRLANYGLKDVPSRPGENGAPPPGGARAEERGPISEPRCPLDMQDPAGGGHMDLSAGQKPTGCSQDPRMAGHILVQSRGKPRAPSKGAGGSGPSGPQEPSRGTGGSGPSGPQGPVNLVAMVDGPQSGDKRPQPLIDGPQMA